LPLQSRYKIWYYVPTTPAANIWDKKTKYRAEKLSIDRVPNPTATGIYTLGHFYTVKFTLTRSHAMRVEALKLLHQVVQLDNISPPHSPPAPPTPRIESSSSSSSASNSDNDNM
jgi:hypothetical protein